MVDHGDKHRQIKRQKTSKKEEQFADEDIDYVEEYEEDYQDGEGLQKRDFSKLELKPDHYNRPLWVCSDGQIFLETFSALYKQAYDFLIAIAELVCRLESMHEYNLTPHSLHDAVSLGLEIETMINVLNKLSKTKIPKEIIDFINGSTTNYGKFKLVLKKNSNFVKSPYPEVLKTLLKDVVITRSKIQSSEVSDIRGGDMFTVSKTLNEIGGSHT